MQEEFDTDTQLMLRFQRGDISCFEQLVERHKQRVANLVYRFLGGRADAEDIAQEVFLGVYRARAVYRPSAKFTTWLYTICRNTCFKELRRRGAAFRSLPEGAREWKESDGGGAEDQRAASPVDMAVRDELSVAVRKAVDSLPQAQRMVVVLRRYHQLSYEEIAGVMRCSTKAVKSSLHRARVSLREKLADFLDK